MNSRARNVAIGSIALSSVSIGSYLTLPVYLVPLTKLLMFQLPSSSFVYIYSYWWVNYIPIIWTVVKNAKSEDTRIHFRGCIYLIF